jgi:hypothetical protein
MAPDRKQRVDNAVNSLISQLVPANPYESAESAQIRHEERAEFVYAILEGCVVVMDGGVAVCRLSRLSDGGVAVRRLPRLSDTASSFVVAAILG